MVRTSENGTFCYYLTCDVDDGEPPSEVTQAWLPYTISVMIPGTGKCYTVASIEAKWLQRNMPSVNIIHGDVRLEHQDRVLTLPFFPTQARHLQYIGRSRPCYGC